MRLFESLREKARAKIPAPPEPPFNFRVGWAASYDALFEEEVQVSSEYSLLTSAIADGRVLLCGRGGSAKTVLLNRLASKAAQNGHLPVKIDLRLWSGREIERWTDSHADNVTRFAQLIESAQIGLTLPIFSDLPPNAIKLLFVDGLNELQSSIGEQIIRVLDLAVTEQLGTRVLVSDRLVRRDLRAPHRWKLASVLPLTEEEVRGQVSSQPDLLQSYQIASPEQRQLLSSPFFLDAFLKRGNTGEDESSTFASFFATIPVSQAELQTLGKSAFELYRKNESRTFPTRELLELVPEDVVRKLTNAGVLKQEEDKAYFRHHLTHDYLAALFFKTAPEKWNQQGFDVISFSASSFDSLGMVLEQIDTAQVAEQFVKELFDWNPYAVAYCLAEQKNDRILSHEMRVVVFAMMAERKFNLIDATARRATDALHLSSGDIAHRLLDAKSLDAVFQVVHEVASGEPWFMEWRMVFSTPRGSSVETSKVRLLRSKDSIIGWTISNVLKRTTVLPEQLKFIKSLSTSRTPVVRWRVVHILGAFPSSTNSRGLLTVLERDSNHWVRVGAVRSLVEMAAIGNSALRRSIFSSIRARLSIIASDQRSRRELESVLLISGVRRKGEWIQLVSALLRELYDEDTGYEASERFERIVRKFNETYV